MKAILVIDMPSSCVMCEVRWSCKIWGKWKGYDDRLDGCPLKSVPKWEINRECAFQNGAPVPDDMVFDFLKEICDESNISD